MNRLHSRRLRCKSERGIALLATMLAIALMVIIVVDFTSSSALGYLSAASHANEIRASYLARSAINVGLALIAQDTRSQQAQAGASGAAAPATGASGTAAPASGSPGTSAPAGGGTGVAAPSAPFDSYASVWAVPFPPMQVNGGTVQLSVVDEARKFDINRLVIGTLPNTGSPAPPDAGQGQLAPGQIDPKGVMQLTQLFAMLGLSPAIVPAIVDWLDRDSIESPGGAEADYYLRLIPPYEPRNGPMPTIGDLHLVKGVDDATFSKLRNYLTVAPEPLVNINTASPEVIACLEPELARNPRLVETIIQARALRPFSNMLDVLNLLEVSGDVQQKLSNELGTTTQNFSISGVGSYAAARKLVFATFRRNSDGTATLASWQED